MKGSWNKLKNAAIQVPRPWGSFSGKKSDCHNKSPLANRERVEMQLIRNRNIAQK